MGEFKRGGMEISKMLNIRHEEKEKIFGKTVNVN